MEAALTVAVLCLSVSVVVLAAVVPFLYFNCFRLEAKVDGKIVELQRQVDTLDDALARLMEKIGVPARATNRLEDYNGR